MEYKVIYEIEVNAETPEKAALIVEDGMKNGNYRPYLTVTSPDGKITDVDLEISEVGVERTPKIDYYLLFIYPNIVPQLKGPFETAELCDEKTKELRDNFGTTAEYFSIEVSNGEKINVDCYASSFFK